MHGRSLNKERWTITFDPNLKSLVQKEARKLHVFPVHLLESLVRERLNPYGFQSIRDSIAYVNSIREQSDHQSDQEFLNEIRQWQKK